MSAYLLLAPGWTPTADFLLCTLESFPRPRRRAKWNTTPKTDFRCPAPAVGGFTQDAVLPWRGMEKPKKSDQRRASGCHPRRGPARLSSRRDKSVSAAGGPRGPVSQSQHPWGQRKEPCPQCGTRFQRTHEDSLFWEELPTERVPEEARKGQVRRPCRPSQGAPLTPLSWRARSASGGLTQLLHHLQWKSKWEIRH